MTRRANRYGAVIMAMCDCPSMTQACWMAAPRAASDYDEVVVVNRPAANPG
jgi:hypothetical protein